MSASSVNSGKSSDGQGKCRDRGSDIHKQSWGKQITRHQGAENARGCADSQQDRPGAHEQHEKGDGDTNQGASDRRFPVDCLIVHENEFTGQVCHHDFRSACLLCDMVEVVSEVVVFLIVLSGHAFSGLLPFREVLGLKRDAHIFHLLAVPTYATCPIIELRNTDLFSVSSSSVSGTSTSRKAGIHVAGLSRSEASVGTKKFSPALM